MRTATPQQRAFTYTVTDQPAGFPVELDTVKLALKISLTNTTEDDLLNAYISAATDYAEKFTRRDFITRTYNTFRDFFPRPYYLTEGYYERSSSFELRRSPLQSVESLKYFVSGLLVTIATAVYYNTIEQDYSELLLADGQTWPGDMDNRLQAIQIDFKTGFGDNVAAVKVVAPWVEVGILSHVANMYKNRGDCGECGDSSGTYLPPHARHLYLQNRIENL